MRLTDLIEQILKEKIRENEGQWTFNRNVLANELNCVPSQVSYVISTRFKSDDGYLVESRRGGGGSIRIQQLVTYENQVTYLMHTLQNLNAPLTQHEVQVYLKNFRDYEIIDTEMAKVMLAALTDQAMASVDPKIRDQVRLEIFKNMLMQIALQAQDEP